MTMYLPNPMVHPAESDPVEFLELPRMATEGRAETSASVERRDSATVHLGSPATGVIQIDGDVILAELASYDEARVSLDQLSTGPHDRSSR